MHKIAIWISAFRLRTLPLSFAIVLTSAAVALQDSCFSAPIFVLELTTTLFLQILSNLSNDYGDTVHGADSANRVGPQRAVQSGAISLSSMRHAMLVFSILSFISGVALLCVGYNIIGLQGVTTLLIIGLLCIAAAITYTSGKHPYGYAGLGDLSVFIFFGLVGVAGCYYLHCGSLTPQIFILATAIGLLSVGVLNMNNIRDMESDSLAGKRSIPLIIGRSKAKVYQFVAIVLAIFLMVTYIVLYGTPLQSLSLVAAIPLASNAFRCLQNDSHSFFDSQLKLISISTFFFSLIFLITGLL